jgi:hypothetical protein
MDVDAQAGAARNRGTLAQPAAVVVGEYTAALRAIDLRGTPQRFRQAWLAHIQAWEATIPYLRGHADERGEMHALFDRWLSSGAPSDAQFKSLHDKIRSSWAQVESAM